MKNWWFTTVLALAFQSSSSWGQSPAAEPFTLEVTSTWLSLRDPAAGLTDDQWGALDSVQQSYWHYPADALSHQALPALLALWAAGEAQPLVQEGTAWLPASYPVYRAAALALGQQGGPSTALLRPALGPDADLAEAYGYWQRLLQYTPHRICVMGTHRAGPAPTTVLDTLELTFLKEAGGEEVPLLRFGLTPAISGAPRGPLRLLVAHLPAFRVAGMCLRLGPSAYVPGSAAAIAAAYGLVEPEASLPPGVLTAPVQNLLAAYYTAVYATPPPAQQPLLLQTARLLTTESPPGPYSYTTETLQAVLAQLPSSLQVQESALGRSVAESRAWVQRELPRLLKRAYQGRLPLYGATLHDTLSYAGLTTRLFGTAATGEVLLDDSLPPDMPYRQRQKRRLNPLATALTAGVPLLYITYRLDWPQGAAGATLTPLSLRFEPDYQRLGSYPVSVALADLPKGWQKRYRSEMAFGARTHYLAQLYLGGVGYTLWDNGFNDRRILQSFLESYWVLSGLAERDFGRLVSRMPPPDLIDPATRRALEVELHRGARD